MTAPADAANDLLQCCLDICSRILRVPAQDVRPDASFFALGGSSMTLMQFAAMLEAARPDLFGDTGVDMVELARAPTLADMPGLILAARPAVTAQAIGGEL